MSVKIRLARRGRKKQAIYDVVVADARAPRDGRFIEKLGTYNPNTNPASININNERALTWLLNGAQPTDTVKAMLSYRGVMLKKHLQIGVLKGAISQEQADAKFNAWLSEKDTKIEGKKDQLATAKEDARKAALAAETAKNQARIDAIKAREAAAAHLRRAAACCVRQGRSNRVVRRPYRRQAGVRRWRPYADSGERLSLYRVCSQHYLSYDQSVGAGVTDIFVRKPLNCLCCGAPIPQFLFNNGEQSAINPIEVQEYSGEEEE